jgi:hypothetical protein
VCPTLKWCAWKRASPPARTTLLAGRTVVCVLPAGLRCIFVPASEVWPKWGAGGGETRDTRPGAAILLHLPCFCTLCGLLRATRARAGMARVDAGGLPGSAAGADAGRDFSGELKGGDVGRAHVGGFSALTPPPPPPVPLLPFVATLATSPCPPGSRGCTAPAASGRPPRFLTLTLRGFSPFVVPGLVGNLTAADADVAAVAVSQLAVICQECRLHGLPPHRSVGFLAALPAAMTAALNQTTPNVRPQLAAGARVRVVRGGVWRCRVGAVRRVRHPCGRLAECCMLRAERPCSPVVLQGVLSIITVEVGGSLFDSSGVVVRSRFITNTGWFATALPPLPLSVSDRSPCSAS